MKDDREETYQRDLAAGRSHEEAVELGRDLRQEIDAHRRAVKRIREEDRGRVDDTDS